MMMAKAKLDIKNIERARKTNEFVPRFPSAIVFRFGVIRGNWAAAIKIEKAFRFCFDITDDL